MTIPHNRPSLDDKEIHAVTKVLQSKWLIAGKEVERFENAMKKIVQVQYAIAVNSGHAALHLSLIALNIGRGDEVIVPSYCVGDVLNAIYYIGAVPVLIDIEKNGFNIDTRLVSQKITQKTKAMIIPHMFGFPAKINELKKFGIPILEDCAQALGTTYQKKPVGYWGDLSIFSFYATKFITTGQGGMVVTNNKNYHEYIKDIIDYNGRDTYKVRYNYSLTDFSASIGNAQLGKRALFLKKRKNIASIYKKILIKKDIDYFPNNEDTHVNHFRFILKCRSESERERIQKLFLKRGIITKPPLNHREILHNLLKQDKLFFPNAEKMARLTLSIPLYPSLSDREVERIAETLDELS